VKGLIFEKEQFDSGVMKYAIQRDYVAHYRVGNSNHCRVADTFCVYRQPIDGGANQPSNQ
jgi:hypothetical protein